MVILKKLIVFISTQSFCIHENFSFVVHELGKFFKIQKTNKSKKVFLTIIFIDSLCFRIKNLMHFTEGYFIIKKYIPADNRLSK